MDFGRGHLKLTEEMAEAGVAGRLRGAGRSRRWPGGSRCATAETIASDGPFAEVKEHLAGFYLIDCESLDEAIGWAAKVPDAANTEVEVRPILDMSGWEF